MSVTRSGDLFVMVRDVRETKVVQVPTQVHFVKMAKQREEVPDPLLP